MISRAIFLLLLLVMPSMAHAQIVEFRSADIVYSRGEQIPVAGWMRATVPRVATKPENRRQGDDPPTIWARFRFDRAQVGPGPTALFSDRMRERYRVYLNGVDLYRTNGDSADETLGWHRPLFLPLPEKLLQPTGNELVYRVESHMARPLAVGVVRVGPDRLLREEFRQRTFLALDGPRTIAGVILTLSIGAFMCWVVRPRETTFGWLALVGFVWAFWDLQYFIYSVPIDRALFWNLTVDSLFLLVWAAYAFALRFFVVPHRRRIILCSAAAVIAVLILREFLLALDLSDKPSFLLLAPLSAATLFVLARACIAAPRAENIMMLGAVALATGFGFHDFGQIAGAYRGASFQLQPYGGLLVFLAFGFALGRRVLTALATVEDVNLTLERRVAVASENLRQSEAARRALEVTNAVDGERERIMREIHDGIGSSLITALAVARREKQSANTIATLRRSIADLRIGVDSLEPVNGDVIMLLANLRHRMDREVGDAGISFVWKTMSAPPLPWLDAIGALHILRILQEAIGNVLAHAGATRIEIDCLAAKRGDADGVLVTVFDNGQGFDANLPSRGRGLANMKARAESLRADLSLESTPGRGTLLSIWFPQTAVASVR